MVPGRAGHRPLARHRGAHRRGRVDLRDRGLGRPGGHLAAQGRGQDRRRPGPRGPRQRPRGRRPADVAGAAQRPGRAPRRAPGRGRCAPRHRPRPRAPGRPGAHRRGDRAAGGAPGARAAHPLAPLHGLGRPEEGAVLGLVRAVPALGGRGERAGRHPGPARHVQGRGPPAAADRPDRLRRRLPAADPPDRQGQPQGPEQHADARAGGRRLALGDRLGRGRARRDPPAAGHVRGLRRLRRRRPASRAWRSRSTWPCSARRTTPG